MTLRRPSEPAVLTASAAEQASIQESEPKERLADRILCWSLRATSLTAGLLVVLILGFLASESIEGISRVGIGRFFSDAGWHPSLDEAEFNMMPMAFATLAATLGAILVAGPAGLMAAVFCCFMAPPKLAKAFIALVQLLAGIPSVVFGLWGLTVLVPIVRAWAPPGPSLFSAIIILALMIVPTVAVLSVASLKQTPTLLQQAAAAAGLSRWSGFWAVAWPGAKAGIGSAVLLATLRAVGETMAVLMVCGNVPGIPSSLFDPVRTLTANIALELGYASASHRSVLFVSGALLMVLVAGFVLLKVKLLGRPQHG